jgi:hypothetical protein
MPLFPEIGTENYNENDRDILKRMSAFYADSISINQTFWQEADKLCVGYKSSLIDLEAPRGDRAQATFVAA